MQKKLIATTRFGGYSVGDQITDPQEIDDLLSNEHSTHVVAVHQGYEDEPAAEQDAQDAPADLARPEAGQPAKSRKPKSRE